MQRKTLFIILIMTGLAMLTSYSLANNKGTLEPLYGVKLVNGQLNIRVKSNGCSQAEHFKVVTKDGIDFQRLAVIRTKIDRCRAMPRIIDMQLDLHADQKMSYQLENLLQSGSQ